MKTLHATDRPAYYRTVWISDVHLGFSGCKAEFLLDFRRSMRFATARIGWRAVRRSSSFMTGRAS
ncbi:MAG: hypothetical protein ACREWE_10735 [Gammaproteobacteria bacterium]